ncbi:MAG: Asp-tRNA(Asn)/Glu-tRNA(Gln) amidotransferase subunit GatC [Ruminococcaceae bacterium]|nr:Asp-tRNA(Asn)/Glu-tRNA(Gln) amidotransferase subunit GatC [Oscillospiraceae bacterium]
MEKAELEHIAGLSKLSFTDEESEKMAEQMGDIIALMDTIRDFDIEYDDTKDNNQIPYAKLREDRAEESFPTEKLMQNAVTGGADDCYVIPKMME